MSDPQAPVSAAETRTRPDHGPAPLAGYLDAVAGQPVLPVATQALVAALEQGWSDPAGCTTTAVAQGWFSIPRARRSPASGSASGSVSSEVFRCVAGGRYGVYQARLPPEPRAHPRWCDRIHGRDLATRACAGVETVNIPVDAFGRIDTEALSTAMVMARPGLRSASHAEVGTVQPVPEVHALCRQAGIPMVSEAIQVAGHRLSATPGMSWSPFVTGVAPGVRGAGCRT